MSNHTNPHGAPYTEGERVLYTELNALIDAIIASPNFDAGSSHAPTADIALSGSMGHGFAFADAFPLSGNASVVSGLVLDAVGSGSVIFGKLVAVDVRGPLTFKALTAGAPGSAQWESGASATWASGSTLTLATGATANLTGITLVRGSITIRKSGGPGSLIVEDDCLLSVEADATFSIYTSLAAVKSGGQIAFEDSSTLHGADGATGVWLGSMSYTGAPAVVSWASGASIAGASGATAAWAGTWAQSGAWTQTGAFTFASSVIPALSPARTWHRCAGTIAAVTNPDNLNDSAARVQFNGGLNTPRLFMKQGIADTNTKAVFEFYPPPDGATIATVTVKSVGQASESVVTMPTYKVIRWTDLDVREEMSSSVLDSHDTADGADWQTTHTMTVTISAHPTIDLAYRYGLEVTAAFNSTPLSISFVLSAIATGTVASIKGT